MGAFAEQELLLPTDSTALVVVDVQNDYCHPAGVFADVGLTVDRLDGLIGEINSLVGAARAAGCPVIWVTMEWRADAEVGLLAERSPFLGSAGLRAGTWGAAIVDGLAALPDDHFVTKSRFSSFYRTDLDELLRELGVSTVVVAGVRTDFCIESTVRDAFFRDYRVVVARGAVAGYFDELHLASLKLMSTVFAQVVDTDQVVAGLTAVPAGGPDGDAR